MSQLGHFLLVADGEGLAMRCALASLGSFALQTGRRKSAFRLRVEPPFRVFFIPNNSRQKIKHPFGCLIFRGGVVKFDGVGYPIYRDLQGIFETFCHVFISFLGCLLKNEKK